MASIEKKNTTALAEPINFAIANRFEGMSEEEITELKDEMGDLDAEGSIIYKTIKMPSGGSLAYEIEGDEEGDAEYVKEFNAVAIFTHRTNAFWPASFGESTDDKDKIPECSSMDGITGMRTGTGEVVSCESCPYNQFGSAADQKGQQAKGKACKNMRRIYLMMSGDPNFYLLSVPPTSIKDVNKQLAKIIASGTPYTGLALKFTLEKAMNSAGVEYSKVVISKAGLLSAEMSSVAKEMRRQIKEQYQAITITADDCLPAAKPIQESTAKPGGEKQEETEKTGENNSESVTPSPVTAYNEPESGYNDYDDGDLPF